MVDAALGQRRVERRDRSAGMAPSAPPNRPSTGDAASSSQRRPAPGRRCATARRACRTARSPRPGRARASPARNDIRPPMQNPIVNGALATPSSRSEARRQRRCRPEMPAHVVCLHVGHVVEARRRAGSAPAVRPNQSIASASTPRARRSAARAPRRTGAARGRRAGSRRRPRSARRREPGTPRSGCRRRPRSRSAGRRGRRRRSARWAVGCRDRSTSGRGLRDAVADRIVPPTRIVPPIGCAEIVALRVESSRIVHDARRPPGRRPDAVHESSPSRTQMRRNRRIAVETAAGTAVWTAARIAAGIDRGDAQGRTAGAANPRR